MTREPYPSTKFKKDLRRVAKRQYDMPLLRKVMTILENGGTLGEEYGEHVLHGVYEGFNECHVKPDWLLIYLLYENRVVYSRTGTHSDLFG